MTTCSSILAWEIPWTEEPGRLQSMGLQRVRRNLATKPSPPCVYNLCIYLRIYIYILLKIEKRLHVHNPITKNTYLVCNSFRYFPVHVSVDF